MSQDEQRAAVVLEAREWFGTPYHHNAQIKGVGTDCAMFPAAVYHAVGLVPELKPHYARQWYQHHDEEIYLSWVRPYATEIDPAGVQAGDFLIWKFGRTFSHGGIALDGQHVIHALMGVGVTTDNRSQHRELNARPCKAFTLWTP